jgi:tagatose-6-phosphate ketose/aldose isomerase
MSTLTSFVDLKEEEQKARGLLFTPREIAQQPATWQTTLHIFKENQARIGDFLDQCGIRGPVEQRPVVMLVGAGTSDYIGHALALLLRKSWGCEVYPCASTTLLTNLEDYIVPGRKYLWISFSRSGDSPEGVEVLQRAAAFYPEIAHLVVTCNAKARMIAVAEKAVHSCVIVLDDAVNDRSLAMTSSFTNMIVTGHCLAHAWSIQEYDAIQQRLVSAAEELLVTGADLAEQAAVRGFSRVCLVGSGPLESVAKESGLKILEMTAGQITTMSETVLGLRHGPMAALNAQTLFVCFVSEDKKKAMFAKDLLTEIGGKQIVSERIAVGPVSAKAELVSACDVYLAIHDGIDDLYRPILDVIFGQLLGLYFSVTRGLKPDAPSPGGVISRVVQEFRIY